MGTFHAAVDVLPPGVLRFNELRGVGELGHPLYSCCRRLRLPTCLYNFRFNFSVTTHYAFPINKYLVSHTWAPQKFQQGGKIFSFREGDHQKWLREGDFFLKKNQGMGREWGAQINLGKSK